MRIYSRSLAALLTTAVTLTAVAANVAPARAQDYNYGGPTVANVSVANGSVLIVRGDSGAQVVATVNAPVVAGDYIVTGFDSDAEVQFDGVSMLRLAANTQVRFVSMDPTSREAQLATGTVVLAELQDGDANPQIDTPSLTMRPNQTGDYRVTVTTYGQTLVTARSGAATLSTPAGTQTITPGYTFVTYGGGQGQRGAVAFDAFDQFNINRDAAVQTAYDSNPYLSPQLAGYSNFASYGQWQDVPGYGYAWAPNNQSRTNFAPYQNGQWVWEPGAGYTWVDNAPYGYATSHYGTWFYNADYGGWLWQPPANQYQNSSTSLASSWLPAVVSFFFSGSGGGIGGLGSLLNGGGGPSDDAGNTNIGWIPLAPGEQYLPSYARNDSYQTTSYTNVTNVTNIYNYYSNARYAGGATMVPVRSWRTGSFAKRVAVQPEQLKQLVLVRGAIPIVPTTENLRYAPVAKTVTPIVISRIFQSPRLLAKAPPVTAISFKTQQAQIQSIVKVAPKERTPVRVPVIKPVARPATPVAAPERTPVATPERTPIATPERTPIAIPERTPVATEKPVRTPEPVAIPVRTPAPTPKPVRTPEPIAAPVRTPVPTPRPVRTPEPVVTPARTPVSVPVSTPRPTPRPTAPPTPKPTPRPTATPTAKPAPPRAPAVSPSPSAPPH
jgi:hypothetical protein